MGYAPNARMISTGQPIAPNTGCQLSGKAIYSMEKIVSTHEDLRATSLFDAITHGDDEHRAWLKEAIEQHFSGRPVSRPRGQGAAETLRKHVKVLEGELEWIANSYSLDERETTYRARVLILRARKALVIAAGNHEKTPELLT